MVRDVSPGPLLLRSRLTPRSLIWMDLCASVRALVAEANREAGEIVLNAEMSPSGTVLEIYLPEGRGCLLQFDPEHGQVTCVFPHSPSFDRTLLLLRTGDAPNDKGVWVHAETGRHVSDEEIAGDLVRNLLIMTSDY